MLLSVPLISTCHITNYLHHFDYVVNIIVITYMIKLGIKLASTNYIIIVLKYNYIITEINTFLLISSSSFSFFSLSSRSSSLHVEYNSPSCSYMTLPTFVFLLLYVFPLPSFVLPQYASAPTMLHIAFLLDVHAHTIRCENISLHKNPFST